MGDGLNNVDDRGFLLDLQELKKSYQGTLRWLQNKRVELESAAESGDGEADEDLKIIKGMISDVNFAIEWLHTGRRPGNKRGIERRSVYQNTVLLDPIVMQNFTYQNNSRSGSTLTQDQLFKLEEALRRLSPQERECFELAHGRGLPHSEVANLLCISKGAVDKYIQRAQRKVSGELQGNLFLWESE